MQNDDNDQNLSCESVQENSVNAVNSGNEDSDDEEEIVFVHRDPKEWSKDNIASWIKWISKKFKVYPKLEPGRFTENAEELAKFNKADFWVCSGSNIGGNVISKHYGYLMEKNEIGSAEKSLLNDSDPGLFI